ncbi:hypothetical protein [Stenotrophomonas sp. 24(2023)]|uniref:hypothetical protein n=1 Tax=Stenotrophomonas sp. 24(2023) TaxID=3068324 RepID=UPI0027E0C448|nr:hypothetical protein [Stenotrophomonas sp. 24(2023)]WMJ70176.1 hypothetical protein Q9R17_03460 [Stenotrophomonas sp. 24(2023)]
MEHALTRAEASRWLLQAWLAARRVTPTRWLLAALCLLALGAGGLALQAHRQLGAASAQQEALRQQIRRLDAPVGRHSGASATPVGGAGHLARFQAVLSEHEVLGPSIETLFALADAHGLELRAADYQYHHDSASGIYQCQISLPVKGDYASIWAFVLDVLQSLPFAALQDISFRRTTITDPAPQALLRVTLYMNRPDTP